MPTARSTLVLRYARMTAEAIDNLPNDGAKGPKSQPCVRCGAPTRRLFPSDYRRGRRFCSTRCFYDPVYRHSLKVDRSAGPNACWPWTGRCTEHGYGYLRHNGRKGYLAHRFAYEAVHGSIPASVLVLHRCDNRPCCNPAHLYAGTHRDNTNDAINRGRLLQGEKHPAAKLTDQQVAEIRRRRQTGSTYRVIQNEFGISRSYLGQILNHKVRKPSPAHDASLAPQLGSVGASDGLGGAVFHADNMRGERTDEQEAEGHAG